MNCEHYPERAWSTPELKQSQQSEAISKVIPILRRKLPNMENETTMQTSRGKGIMLMFISITKSVMLLTPRKVLSSIL